MEQVRAGVGKWGMAAWETRLNLAAGRRGAPDGRTKVVNSAVMRVVSCVDGWDEVGIQIPVGV